VDPLVGGAIVAGVGSLLGGGQAQKASRRESARNRAFQERMRNTQWQAAVEDMRAAGINPALAYSRGPNAAPGGSVAAQGDITSGLGSATSNALQARMQRKQLEVLESQARQANAQAWKTREEAQSQFINTRMDLKRYDFYFNSDGTPTRALQELIKAEYGAKMANNARSVSESQLSALSVPEREALAKLFSEVGGAGKGIQTFLPLILSLMRGR
jgi:hypothetical protein